jgi:hypothetical protein
MGPICDLLLINAYNFSITLARPFIWLFFLYYRNTPVGDLPLHFIPTAKPIQVHLQAVGLIMIAITIVITDHQTNGSKQILWTQTIIKQARLIHLANTCRKEQ